MDVLSTVLSYAFVYVATQYYNQTITPTLNWTAINGTTWWADAPQAQQDTRVIPTNITFGNNMLTDLRRRISRNVSYIAPLENSAFTYGFNRDQLASWTNYWNNSYNFTARQAFLNQFPSYRTNIAGLNIHFIRVNPQADGLETVPVLMLHGFPGSVRDYMDAIPYLTEIEFDRDFALELIIPSLPGYGYSSHTNRTGFGAVQAAVVLRGLMQRLGYRQYYVQGSGDMGSIIGGHIATFWPEEVLGFHTNWAHVLSPTAVLLQAVGSLAQPFIVNSDNADRMYPIYDIFIRTMQGLGYLHEQATKPETLLVVYEDSAIGFLAYVIEIIAFQTNYNNRNDPEGGLLTTFSRDTLIDEVMMYWAPGSIGSSFRLFADTFNRAQLNLRLDEIPTPVPMWPLQPRYALSYQSPLILRLKYPNLLQGTTLDYGGHFFQLERPQEFATDVIRAITAFREFHDNGDVIPSPGNCFWDYGSWYELLRG